jgi:hypothetical protein
MMTMSDLLEQSPELAALRDRLLVTDDAAASLGRQKLTALIFLLSGHLPLPSDRLIAEKAAIAMSGVLTEDFAPLMARHGFAPVKSTARTRYWRVRDVYRMMRGDE